MASDSELGRVGDGRVVSEPEDFRFRISDDDAFESGRSPFAAHHRIQATLENRLRRFFLRLVGCGQEETSEERDVRGVA